MRLFSSRPASLHPHRSARARARAGARVLAAAALSALASAGRPASALEFQVQGIAVSSGGSVNGTDVSIPVGGSVTIGARLADAGSTPVMGLGASYYGWDPHVLSFVSGSAVDSLFHSACVPGSPPVGGSGNLAPSPLVETTTGVGGSAPGSPNVRVLVEMSLPPATTLAGDAGLDGECGGGDAQFRLTFWGVSPGQTTITIGTGDDEDGILVVPGQASQQAGNATVNVTVPEPGQAISMLPGVLGLLALGRARGARRRLARGVLAESR